MPYINIRIGKKISTEQKNQLFQQTTDLMQTVMGKNPAVTVVHIDESIPEQWGINSGALTEEQPTGAYVNIKITDGTNSAEEKSEMIEKTVSMLKEVVGTIQEACYVVINDIPADSWGYDGKTQAARLRA